MNEKELLELKQDISEVKDEISRTEGRKEAILDQLKENHGLKSIADAEKKIETLNKEIDEWDKKIESATNKLLEQLEGGDDPDTASEDGPGEGEEVSARKRTPRTQRRTPR